MQRIFTSIQQIRITGANKKRGSFKSIFEQYNESIKVIENFNKNNFAMAEGKVSEIQILEQMPGMDYFTHFYNWINANRDTKGSL